MTPPYTRHGAGPRLRYSGTQRLVSQATGKLPPGKTIGSIHQLPNGSLGIRFELVNRSTECSAVYNACYALSAGINDWVTPLNAEGVPDNDLWTPITASCSPTLTVPRARAETHLGRLVTDLMPFTRPPPIRIDGGSGVCLFYRQYCLSGIHTIGNFDGTVPDWQSHKNGQHPSQFSQSFGGGWLVHNNHCVKEEVQVARSDVALFAGFAPHAIMPTATLPILTLMSVGDSILSGIASRGDKDAGVNGIGLQVVKRWDKPNRPALHRNGAVSAQSNSDYIADALLAIDAFVPDAILLQPYSANEPDAIVFSVVWTQFQRSLAFAAEAMELGSHVLLVSAPPYAGRGSDRQSSTWEDSRTYANSLLRGVGMPVLDLDHIMGVGSDPVSYLPSFSDDGVHPNDSGASIAAAIAAEIFRDTYGIS